MTIGWLRPHTTSASANLPVRDPHRLLRALNPGLKAAGVPGTQVHFELFGPADEAIAA